MNYSAREENGHITIENDQINDREKDTYEFDLKTCSNDSRNTIVLRLEYIYENIIDSDGSTTIIYNHKYLSGSFSPERERSTVIIDQSLFLSKSDETDKNQSNEDLNDMKLKRLRPMVFLEQLKKQVNVKTSKETRQSKKIVKHKNRSKGKGGRPKKYLSLEKRRKTIDYSRIIFFGMKYYHQL